MKIFLDVGGNVGQTLDKVLMPPYQFDIVHCFEPQAACYAELERKFSGYSSGNLVLHHFGLADFDGVKELYGTGIGASLFSDKCDIDNRQTERCRFVRASSFFAEYIGKEDLVAMKLNCEGGEMLILRDLMKSGDIHSLSTVMIDFDIKKIPSQRREQEKILSELKAAGFRNYAVARQVRSGFLLGKKVEGIGAWLSTSPDAAMIMKLTVGQKIARCLPFAVRCYIEKRIRRARKLFFKMRGKYPG